MNRRTSSFLVAALAWWLGPGIGSSAGDDIELDLTAAIQRALNHNRDLARAGLLLKSRELDVAGARADFSIRVRPEGNAGVSDDADTWQYGLVAAKRFLPGTEVETAALVSRSTQDDTDERRASVRVEIRQPLFRNFGRLMQGEGIVQANQQLRTARRDYEQRKADLIVSVVESYERILQLGSQIQSDESFYNRLEKLYRLTQAREKQGRNTRVDSLRVELQRGQALSRLENNRERLYSTQQDFAELLGFDPAQTFRLDTPPRFTFDIPPIEEAVRIALENRLDYAQVLQDLQDARRGVKIARRRLHPALNLVARYERFGEGDGFSEVSTLDEDTVLFGLSTDADFNQARERASFGQAVIDEESGRQIIRIREVSIAREVQQQLAAHRRAQTDVSIAGRNFRLADNRARLARRLFESGRGDNFSVTDAEDAYVQAQAQLLAATAEASISTYRILRVLGTLMEFPEELKPGALRAAL